MFAIFISVVKADGLIIINHWAIDLSKSSLGSFHVRLSWRNRWGSQLEKGIPRMHFLWHRILLLQGCDREWENFEIVVAGGISKDSKPHTSYPYNYVFHSQHNRIDCNNNILLLSWYLNSTHWSLIRFALSCSRCWGKFTAWSPWLLQRRWCNLCLLRSGRPRSNPQDQLTLATRKSSLWLLCSQSMRLLCVSNGLQQTKVEILGNIRALQGVFPSFQKLYAAVAPEVRVAANFAHVMAMWLLWHWAICFSTWLHAYTITSLRWSHSLLLEQAWSMNSAKKQWRMVKILCHGLRQHPFLSFQRRAYLKSSTTQAAFLSFVMES